MICTECHKKMFPVKREKIADTDRMVFFAGSDRAFRCECGCNVFRSPVDKPLVYICNSCDARWVGEQ